MQCWEENAMKFINETSFSCSKKIVVGSKCKILQSYFLVNHFVFTIQDDVSIGFCGSKHIYSFVLFCS